jgi:hypothetical protein
MKQPAMKQLAMMLALVPLLTCGCNQATSSPPGSGAPAPVILPAPESGTTMPSSIVDPYLKIHTALYRDSIDNIRANAGNVATAATAFGAPAMKIDRAAVQLASATELPDARAKFETLSNAIVTYMDGLHLTPPEGVSIVSCETTKKQWLQAGDRITNPYEGASAPSCGSFR